MTDRRLRSLLFVPGGRADMIGKARRYGADAVVVDLEDTVAPADKELARATAIEAIRRLQISDETTWYVRVNPVDSEWFAEDVKAAAGVPGVGVVLPKLRRVTDVQVARSVLEVHGRPSVPLVVGLESADGVAGARGLLAAGVDAAYFGAEDYIADLGGRRTAHGREVLYARSEVALAGRLAGTPVLDQVVVAVRDDEHFRRDALEGAAIGYTGKICLHPQQVTVAHEVFTPTVDDVAHARAVLAAGAAGVGIVDGEMVDAVHLKMARATLSRAGLLAW